MDKVTENYNSFFLEIILVKKPLNLFLRFIIVFGLVFTVGNLLAYFIYKDRNGSENY